MIGARLALVLFGGAAVYAGCGTASRGQESAAMGVPTAAMKISGSALYRAIHFGAVTDDQTALLAAAMQAAKGLSFRQLHALLSPPRSFAGKVLTVDGSDLRLGASARGLETLATLDERYPSFGSYLASTMPAGVGRQAAASAAAFTLGLQRLLNHSDEAVQPSTSSAAADVLASLVGLALTAVWSLEQVGDAGNDAADGAEPTTFDERLQLNAPNSIGLNLVDLSLINLSLVGRSIAAPTCQAGMTGLPGHAAPLRAPLSRQFDWWLKARANGEKPFKLSAGTLGTAHPPYWGDGTPFQSRYDSVDFIGNDGATHFAVNADLGTFKSRRYIIDDALMSADPTQPYLMCDPYNDFVKPRLEAAGLPDPFVADGRLLPSVVDAVLTVPDENLLHLAVPWDRTLSY